MKRRGFARRRKGLQLSTRREDPRLARRFSRRALLVGGAQGGLMLVLVNKLHELQVLKTRKYKLLAEENRVNELALAPVRGRIFDRFGKLLARNEDWYGIAIVPDLAGDVKRVLRHLAILVPEIDADERARVLKKSRKQSRNIPIELNVDITWQMLARISVLAPRLPGVQTFVGTRRRYFGGAAIGQIVGYVGKVERFAIDGDPALRLPGMRIGKLGLERGSELALRGKGGYIRREVDARGRIVRQLEKVPATAGEDVVSTIDLVLQRQLMGRLRAEHRAAAVVLDARHGDILAMGSNPSFDPNDIVGGMTQGFWDKIRKNPGHPLSNKAIRGLFPPGSTIKMVAALAGLEAGLITPKSRLLCEGSYTYANHEFGCWKRSGHGYMRLHDAIKWSCDVYFYRLAEQLGITRLSEMAKRLGLGVKFDIELPSIKQGVFPDPVWKLGALDRAWLGGETLLAAIGQGYVQNTPLQLAVMTARIASGKNISPRIARRKGDERADIQSIGIAKENLDLVRSGMDAVVNEGGTASGAALALDGVRMAGKTGTAQVTRESRGRGAGELEWAKRDHSLFVGYAPTLAPKYAIAAIVEHGGGGSVAAAPLVRDLMTSVLARDPAARVAYPAKNAGAIKLSLAGPAKPIGDRR